MNTEGIENGLLRGIHAGAPKAWSCAGFDGLYATYPIRFPTLPETTPPLTPDI